MYELPLPATIKRLIRQVIPEPLWLRLKEKQRQAAFDSPGPYSFDEPAILRQIDAQPEVTPFFVDIGAQDGVLGSQTLALAKRGWQSISEKDLLLSGIVFALTAILAEAFWDFPFEHAVPTAFFWIYAGILWSAGLECLWSVLKSWKRGSQRWKSASHSWNRHNSVKTVGGGGSVGSDLTDTLLSGASPLPQLIGFQSGNVLIVNA